jgi:hypothetical protein
MEAVSVPTAARNDDGEHYSAQLAAEHAVSWCAAHPGWQRICDIEDVNALYKTYAELSSQDRRYWERHGGEVLWLEFGRKPCKVPHGFVTGKGEFYWNILEVPIFHNIMTVYKTS